MADEGYADPKYFINSRYYPEISPLIKRVMRRHETVNERLKNFNVLSNRFRHSVFKHSMCFNAVCAVVHLKILNGENLYDV